jgi:predicted amidohydrolase YtcJ
MARETASRGIAGDNSADLVLKNGDVYTGLPDRPRVHAVAVRGDVIAAIGTDAEIAPLIGPKTRVVDLQGRFAMPGFNDAHLHLVSGGLAKFRINLEGAKSLAEFQERIRSRLGEFGPGEWILGQGWDHTLWPEQRFPTRADLDAISRDHPMIFWRTDGHVAVANSKALELAGITEASVDPPGGKFARDPATGKLTGLLEEDSAMNIVGRRIPGVALERRRRAIELALEEASSYGVTSIQDNSEEQLFAYYEEFPDGKTRDGRAATGAAPGLVDFEIYRALEREGKLKVRITEWLPFNAPVAKLNELKAQAGTPTPWLKTGALKGFLDGSLGSRTAAMLAPYSDDPATSGILRVDPERLKQMAIERDRAGFQIALHAIGDRANRVGLDAYEAARKANGARDRRDRIEHAQVIALSDLPRFAALEVIPSMQPVHVLDDERWAEARVGPERVKGAYAWNTLSASGARLAFGTDFPVEGINPLRGIYACVTRELPEGGPAGGWQPQEKLPIDACIRDYTIGSAYAEFDEARKGQLRAGMLADIVVFPADITKIAPKELLQTKVSLTIAGGKIVYDSAAH